MSSDILARATGALRDSAAPSQDGGALTFARISRTLRANEWPRISPFRRLTRFVLLPIAAVFVASGAFAGATGRLGHLFAAHASPELEHELPGHAAPPRSLAASPALLAPATTVSSIVPTVLLPPPTASSPATTRAPRASAAASDADTLYREAHATHFVDRDYATAVVRWDRYLAMAGPGGRFVVEARYNRALALFRLGRRADAAAALRPFADGEYGGYRRDEAKNLLVSIDP
jgi:hypothetical protein